MPAFAIDAESSIAALPIISVAARKSMKRAAA
jgi:hypothetical protein